MGKRVCGAHVSECGCWRAWGFILAPFLTLARSEIGRSVQREQHDVSRCIREVDNRRGAGNKHQPFNGCEGLAPVLAKRAGVGKRVCGAHVPEYGCWRA